MDLQCFVQKLLFLLELLLQALYFHLQLDVLQQMKVGGSVIIHNYTSLIHHLLRNQQKILQQINDN